MAQDYESTAPNENECLIDRGSRWRVVGKRVGLAGEIELTVELVDQAAKSAV